MNTFGMAKSFSTCRGRYRTTYHPAGTSTTLRNQLIRKALDAYLRLRVPWLRPNRTWRTGVAPKELQALMTQLAWSKQDVANFAHCTVDDVSKWLAGSIAVPTKTATALKNKSKTPKPILPSTGSIENRSTGSTSTDEPSGKDDTSIGLNNPLVRDEHILAILDKHGPGHKHHGMPFCAILRPGGQAIIATGGDQAVEEMIREVLEDETLIEALSSLYEIEARFTASQYKTGPLVQIPLIFEQMTFVFNLFGRHTERDRYYFTEAVVPIVATSAYRPGLLVGGSQRLVRDLRALASGSGLP